MKYYNLQTDPNTDYNNPAECCITWPNGDVGYYVGDNAHRTDGPALIKENGYKTWMLHAKIYYDNKSFQRDAGLSDEDMLAMILKYGDVGPGNPSW